MSTKLCIAINIYLYGYDDDIFLLHSFDFIAVRSLIKTVVLTSTYGSFLKEIFRNVFINSFVNHSE